VGHLTDQLAGHLTGQLVGHLREHLTAHLARPYTGRLLGCLTWHVLCFFPLTPATDEVEVLKTSCFVALRAHSRNLPSTILVLEILMLL
jgi:hypothetical protein